MTKPQEALVSDDGQLYLLKKPLHKQGLFWSTLVFGCAALLFLLTTISLSSEKDKITAALERYDMYYDADDEDIYNYAVEWEYDLTPVRDRLSETTLTVVEQLMDEPNQVPLTALEPALADIKTNAKDYALELDGFFGELIATEELSDEEVTDLEESLESYKGYVNMSVNAILETYQLKEEQGRDLTQEEIDSVQLALTSLLYDVSDDWEESLDLSADRSV